MIQGTASASSTTDNFLCKLDCSQAVDIIHDKKLENVDLTEIENALLSSTMFCTEISKRVRLTLTSNYLIFCSGSDESNNCLIYNPVQIKHVSIRTALNANELIGEYNFQLLVQKQKLFTMVSKSKEERYKWLGQDDKNSNLKGQSSWKPLNDVVKYYNVRLNAAASKFSSNAPEPIRTTDIFTTWTDQSEGVSPLVSSDESEDENNIDFLTYNAHPQKNASSSEEKSLDKYSSFHSSFIQINSMLKDKSPPPVPPKDTSTPQLPQDPLIEYKQVNDTPSVSATEIIPVICFSEKNPSETLGKHFSDVDTLQIPKSSQSTATQLYFKYPSTSLEKQTLNQQQNFVVPSSMEATQQSSSTPSKRLSFMKSVISVVSNRSSFLQNKSQSKKNIERALDLIQNKGSPNLNLDNISFDQQKNLNQKTDPLRRYSAAYSSEPPVSPQQYTAPPTQAPYLNRQSTPSLTSIANSSHSSIHITPPLSRPSSPSAAQISFPRHQLSSASSSDDLGTPPESPSIISRQNSIKTILYTTDQIKVFRWKDESWCTVEANCVLEVRQTFGNRTCVAVIMKSTGQLYLNAWILPDTSIIRTSETDLSLSVHISNSQSTMEDYLFHCGVKSEADKLNNILQQMHEEVIKINTIISATSTLRNAPPDVERSISLAANKVLTPEELAKTLKLAMQCKCKLFVQSGSSKWNSFGSVYMKVSQQYSTKKMHISIDSQKGGKVTQLVSAMVQSYNVERLNSKRISFMLVDEQGKNSVVYMIQVREEMTGDKIIEYIKTKNAENGF